MIRTICFLVLSLSLTGCAHFKEVVERSRLCTILCDGDARARGHLTTAIYSEGACYCGLDDPVTRQSSRWLIPMGPRIEACR